MKNSWHDAVRYATLATLALWAATLGAQTQTYPVKSIRVIVPQSSGSASDTVARVVGQRIGALIGQQLIVDNRPGAGGLTGTEIAAKSAPDGYTLAIASISSHGTIPALYRKLNFDPVKDFAPISLWVTIPNVFVVHPSLPVKNVKELIALITGEISLLFPTLALSRPHIQAGKIRAIAVTTPQRIEEYPQLPTVSETVPGFEMLSWIGLLAPAGTPRAAVDKLNDASAKSLAMPEVRQSLDHIGMTPAPGSPEQFGSFIEAEIAKWTKVARAAKIEAD